MKSHIDNASEMLAAMAHYLESLIATRDIAGAVRYYESNRRELEAVGSPAAGAVLRQAARAYASMTDYPTSLRLARLAQAAYAAEGDTIELAETFMTIAETLRDMGEIRKAEKAFRDAESLFRRNDCLEGQSRALNLLAGLFFAQNNYRNSLGTLMEAIAIAKRLNDRPKLAFMMGNIGRINTFLGDFVQARKHLQINIDLSEELGQPLEVARAALSLGYVYIQEADYEKAETALARARLNLDKVKAHRDEVIYRTYLGELCYRSGRLAEAKTVLEEALSRAEAIDPDSTLAARAMRHLAEALLRLNLDQAAARYAARGLTITERAGEKVEAGALTRIKAELAARAGHRADARTLFTKAIDSLDESGVRFEKVDALVAAGRCDAFEPRKRMTYLFRAEEFYRRNNILGRLQETDRLIEQVDYPPSPSATIPTADVDTGKVDFLTVNSEIGGFKKQLVFVAKSDLPVLLTGDTGVGKDHMARYFHAVSRPGKPLVSVNCASIPETLLESELFGYRRGAFTGADHDKEGLFVAANGGVLYLDEIGDMPLSLQAKLLGVLESRRVIPVGSTEEVSLDIKLIVATNRNLEAMVEQGGFRRDLYYRISGITFHIPALRDRKEDIPLLLKHFLRRCHLVNGQRIAPEVIHQFVEYDWPGNVRELLNKVKRLEVMADLAAEGDLVELTRSIFASEAPSPKTTLFEQVENFERQILTEALLAADGNKSEAARILGIHEATVRTKLKRYGISLQSSAVN